MLQRSSTNLSHATRRSTPGSSVASARRRLPARGEVDRVERLLDVQLARPAVAVDAVPIEQPVGRVAGLLDFGDQQPGAERVHRARFDEDAVANARLELVQTHFARPARQLALQRLPIDARLQAGVDLAARLGGQT